MSAMPNDPPATILRIALPADLLAAFEARAFLAGCAPEELIVRHLTATRDYTAESPIYLDDVHAKEIRRLLGGRVNTPDKLLDMVGRLIKMRVGGKQVEVTPEQQEAMVWFARSLQLNLDDALPQIFKQALGLLLKC